MNNTVHDKVSTIINTAEGNTLDICYVLYCEYLSKIDNPAVILQQILQFDSSIGTDDAPSEKIDNALKYSVTKTFYNLLHETVRVIMRENLPPEQFYQKLYKEVFSSSIFPQTNEARAIILWLLVDRIPEIPYYQAIDLLEKSNEDYREAITRIRPFLKQAVHMLNRHFDSRTEEASQLVRISLEIEDEVDRIVYWSALQSLIKDNDNNSDD